MLTYRRSPLRFHLLLTFDPERAVHGHAAISERYQCLTGEHLFVIGDLVHISYDAEDQTGFVENAAPLELILGRKDSVEDLDQLACMSFARGVGGKARIIEHTRCQTLFDLFPAPFVSGDR